MFQSFVIIIISYYFRQTNAILKMSQDPGKLGDGSTNAKQAPPQSGDGLRSLKTSNLFRNVNFELYVKPNKFVMAFGIIAITG